MDLREILEKEAAGDLHGLRVGQYVYYSRAEVEACFGNFDRQRVLDYTNPTKVIERVIAELLLDAMQDSGKGNGDPGKVTDVSPGKARGFEYGERAA